MDPMRRLSREELFSIIPAPVDPEKRQRIRDRIIQLLFMSRKNRPTEEQVDAFEALLYLPEDEDSDGEHDRKKENTR